MKTVIAMKWQRLAESDRRALRILGAVLLLGAVYGAVVVPSGAALESAQERLQQARSLNQSLADSLGRGLVPVNVLSGEALRTALSQGSAAAGLELRNLSRDGQRTQTLLSGPAEPLLRWLGDLEARGARMAQLRLTPTADGLLEAAVHWQ